VAVRAIVPARLEAAALETEGPSRKGKGHSGQAFQQAQRRREPSGAHALRLFLMGKIYGVCS